MATPYLLKLAQAYLDIVDNGTADDQHDKRTLAHEALMDAMEREHIPFNSRFEARWIARWLVAQSKDATFEPRLMFAKTTPDGTVYELHFTPPDDNKAGLIPIMCVLLPYTDQPFTAERNT